VIDLTQDIHSLTDFKRKTILFMKRLKTQQRALVLTVNGKAAIVVQDPKSYQKLLQAADAVSKKQGH